MGVYKGIAQDNVTINSGKATLGSLSLTGLMKLPVAAVAATGSDNTDAAAVGYGVTHVTAANATKGVKLPAAVAGAVVIIKNADAANAVLKVYPGTDDKINSGTATTGALSMAAKTSAMFVAISDVDWFTLPLLPS